MCGIARFLGEFVPGLVYFPVHPRTRERMESPGLVKGLDGSQVHLLPPLPYKSFLRLYKDVKLVMTDSGGIQEETTALGIPCFTLRENTERPVTIEEGTNTLVGKRVLVYFQLMKFLRKGVQKKVESLSFGMVRLLNE